MLCSIVCYFTSWLCALTSCLCALTSWFCSLYFLVQLTGQNPIMKNITECLIEEVSAGGGELLGSAGGADPEEGTREGNPAEITVERDDNLVTVCPPTPVPHTHLYLTHTLTCSSHTPVPPTTHLRTRPSTPKNLT